MTRRALIFVVDIFILALAFFFAYLVRFNGLPPPALKMPALIQLPYVVLLQFVVLTAAGLHKTSWRYVSLSDLPRVAVGLMIAATVLMVLRVGLPDAFRFGRVPGGVILADMVFAGVGLLSARILRRLTSEHSERRSLAARREQEPERVLLIGAGRAGAMIAKELLNRPDVGLEPVGFVDDDPDKIGTYIHGVKVLGATDKVGQIARDMRVTEAVISIANAPGDTVRRIHDVCVQQGLDVRIIPGLYEILDGRVNISRIREVDIEDLLGREPVELDRDAIASYLEGKRVLVTGAGGSIGSELCRQIAGFGPARLVLVDQGETALFYMDRELRRVDGLDVRPIVADICDRAALARVFREHEPEVVFHAAAYKHVPMMETNPIEAVKNNVFGSKNVMDLAVEAGCDVLVNISTDKAVNPTSVMGATKRVAELYLQAKARGSKTTLVAVRFGNVLGSSGSVIPIFREQIAAGGPVTVTHPDMRRYFMTIPEASQLVMQAATLARGGEIFVLDMGDPVKIVDLAKDMIRLSGFLPDKDIKVEFTGVRPGEKLFEELALDGEGVDKTRHPKIFVGKLEPYASERVAEILERLGAALETADVDQVRRALQDALPEYHPSVPDQVAPQADRSAAGVTGSADRVTGPRNVVRGVGRATPSRPLRVPGK